MNNFLDIKHVDDDFFIKDDVLFFKITCFLTFNTCAMIGSFMASFVQWVCIKLMYDICSYL